MQTPPPDINWNLELLRIGIPALVTLLVGTLIFWRQEKFKSALTAKHEKLKSDLAKELHAHQIRESHLYQKRAAAIEEIFAAIAMLEDNLKFLTNHEHAKGFPVSHRTRPLGQIMDSAASRISELRKLLIEKEIYFDEDVIWYSSMLLNSLTDAWNALEEIRDNKDSKTFFPTLVDGLEKAKAGIDDSMQAFKSMLSEKFRAMLEGHPLPVARMIIDEPLRVAIEKAGKETVKENAE